MNFPKKHLFICTNAPDLPNRVGKCGYLNADHLLKTVKEACKNRPDAKEIRINKSGCLGQCEHGIAAVLYPEGKWFLDLKAEDSEKLMTALEENNK